MKKIFRISVIVSLCAAMVSLAGCTKKELDVDPMGDNFSFAGLAPNPVMRGGSIRIFGRSLDLVQEVQFAGDVTVTEADFVKLSKGVKLDTLELKVPLEGPEVGKVKIVAKDGRILTSQADLTFTESIEVESFSPASALSGDVITFKGEYLNVVKEVIFSGEDAFTVTIESQSRHELKVKVPANAISGPIILSDVNEVEDDNTIPNHIYTKTDLTVGNPTVTKAAKATYKSGDVITVKGAHLDMIKNVALPQVEEVEFEVAEDAASLKFNLPPKAADGNITLTSYAGVEFDAGEIETVNVSELSVKSLAEDTRFKAGCQVEISGADLDLVTKVEFTGAEADWYMDGDKIITTQPAAAQDGAVTVTLESGKKAYSDDIEVVKPLVTGVDKTEAVAGVDTVFVTGTDLDLVVAAKIGNKAQSFIDCEFKAMTNEDDQSLYIAVIIPDQAYSGPITLTAESAYETSTVDIAISYDMAVAIHFDELSFALGKNISFTGQNLMQIEQVFVKGKKVTGYVTRTDAAMAFAIPEGVGPGVYRLALVLIDGTELTWPVPFEITAPYTETFYWEGSEDLGSWSSQPYLGADGALAGNIVVGDLIRIYYTPYAAWWQFEIFDGHWGGMSFPELDGGKTVSADNMDPDAKYFAFEVTEDNIGALTSSQGWGGIFVVQGESVILTAVSVIHFGASEDKNVIWEGSHEVNWGGDDEAHKALTALSWGGYDWSSVAAGTVLRLTFERTADEVQIRLGNGSWAALPGTEDPFKPEGTELEVELTQAMIDEMVANGGLVITGQGYTLQEVALVSTTVVGPVGTPIWEGSHAVDWGGDDEAHKALTTLSWGGYDWGSVAAGTTLKLEFERTADEVQIRLGNGSWAALPGTEDPFKPEGTELEVELTQAMIDEMVANGGLVITGQGYTLTAVILI